MSQLPADLAEAIEAVPGWNVRAVTAFSELSGGITNRNFKVEIGEDAFVVRLLDPATALLGIDRATEEEAGRAAAATGVGPEVVAALPGALITRFVDGTPIPQEDLERLEVLASVVRSVRLFHACPPLGSAFPVFRIVERYRDLAASRGVAIPSAYGDVHAVADRIEAALAPAPMPLATCHNDFLNANFLLEGDHTWIVDYEYAGMGDPYFDLGNLSINNGLGPEAQELLLELYFGDVRDGHRARHGLMRIMSDFREAMWGVAQQALSTLEFDYVDYADRHFDRSLTSAADPRFEAWLDDVAAAA
jgi:thiamine kinase-like enzyme